MERISRSIARALYNPIWPDSTIVLFLYNDCARNRGEPKILRTATTEILKSLITTRH